MPSVPKPHRPVPTAAILDGSASHVHRAMNERRCAIAQAAAESAVKCECSKVECFSGFLITIREYEAVRARADRFIVAPGHESPDESVIVETAEYLVIETKPGAGRVA
jgi:hypothetical protein